MGCRRVGAPTVTPLVPNRAARRSFIALQGLAEPPRKALTQEELAHRIERLGFVQVDSINTVVRAHHHILFSRNGTYRQAQLKRLHEREAAVFENWTHDASIIPVAFFPHWRHRFAREKERLHARWSKWRDEAYHRELDVVLERIARDGPVMARDFEGREKPSTGWWDWHPSKTALEYLWRTGELAIARREGFQKVYDLAERVIPAGPFKATVDHEAFINFACEGALDRLGFATRGEIAAFFALIAPDEVAAWIARNANRLVEVLIESADGSKPRAAFARPEHLEGVLSGEPPAPPERVRVLNPFDPLLRDRNRAERLFGIRYRIEVFVPEAKREYGYYVFPVMRGDAIVGRIDMKAERDRDRLAVRRFWPEPGLRISKALLSGLEAELDRMRRFAGVADTEFAADWLG